MKKALRDKQNDLLKMERGTVFKRPEGRVSVCLVYPNTYHVGMSNLGFQGVYALFNARDDVLCERAFLPDATDLDEHLRTGAPVLSLESGRPISGFDIIAFSVSFENDYPSVLRMLQLSGVPLEGGSRGEMDPLVVMGGVCSFSNPEPLSEFMDICFIGEAEGMLDEFMDMYLAVKEAGGGKGKLLKEAVRIEGFYVPSFYRVYYDDTTGCITRREALEGAPLKLRRRYVRDISLKPLTALVTTTETEFSGMRLVEAMRGCPWGCRFCLAGHVYNPPRKKMPRVLMHEIKDARRNGARVGLVGPSLTDYPHWEEALVVEKVDLSITSLRASPKSAEVAALLKGIKSVSIAPEAGTQRLRDYIGKKITAKDILETAGMLHQQGVKRLRLYFMIGLPTETEEDVDAIPGLVAEVRDRFESGRITLTLSTFVPKPFTPFERLPMMEIGTIKARLRTVKKALKNLRGVHVFNDVPKYALMQGLFALGDRRVGAVLKEMLLCPDWREAAGRVGVAPEFYITREKPMEESLPWDFIEQG